MKIFQKLIWSFIFFYPNLIQAQQLDSLITYTFADNGQRRVGAKSYWRFDAALNEMNSSYYIYNAEEAKFIHINDQQIKYLPQTRYFEIFRTVDYSSSRIDSTVYRYNSGQINIEKLKYVSELEGDQKMSLYQVEKYIDLDQTNRKTNELIQRIREGEIAHTTHNEFEYVYNDKNELIEKIEYNIVDEEKVPRYKLVQSYDNGKIQSVVRFNYDPGKAEFVRLFLAEYTFKGKERIQQKTNYTYSADDKRRVEIDRILYLNEEGDILTRQFYVKAIAPENLYREDVYYQWYATV